MDASATAKLLAVAGLIAANAFFVAAEFALRASRREGPDESGAEARGPEPRVVRARRALDRPISATRAAVTLCSLALGWLGVGFLAPHIHAGLDAAGIPLPSGVGFTLAVVLALAGIAVLYLLLGELVPRALALTGPGRVARAVALPVHLLGVLLAPLLWLLNVLAAPIVSRSGVGVPGAYGGVHGPEEIEALLRHSRAEGVVEEDEEEMIHGVFELTRTVAREVMTPRPDIVAFPETATLDEVLSTAVESGYSRFPVYRESIDDVTGVVLIKDLLRWIRPQPPGDFSLTAVMRDPFFVPDTKPVDDLLAELRDYKLHLAVVVDEFGGTDGLVTLEDLMEEIVGDIFDEHDVAQEEIVVLGEGRARIDGGTDPADLIELFGLGEVDDVDEYDTVAGYVIGRLGRIPETGETVRLGSAELEVAETIERRVTSLLLHVVGAAPQPEGPGEGEAASKSPS